MKCIKCGKEIPDGSAFCGFCGAPQNEEPAETKPEETAPVEVNTPEEPIEPEAVKPAEEVTPEEVPAETPAEEVPAEETKPAEEPQTEAAPAEEPKQEEAPAEKTEPIDVTPEPKPKKPKKQYFKKEEFSSLLDVLKNPFTEHEVALVPALCVLVLNIITFGVFAGHFGYGLLCTLLLYLFVLILDMITVHKFDLNRTTSRTASFLLVPSILLLLSLLFRVSPNFDSMMNVSGISVFLHTFLVILASVIFILSAHSVYKEMNPYLFAVLTVLFVCLVTDIILEVRIQALITAYMNQFSQFPFYFGN